MKLPWQRLIVASLFASAGVQKLRSTGDTKSALESVGFGDRASERVAIVLPVVELGIAAGAVFPATRQLSFHTASALLTEFSTFLMFANSRVSGFRCNCFGDKGVSQSLSASLLRNLLLVAITVYREDTSVKPWRASVMALLKSSVAMAVSASQARLLGMLQDHRSTLSETVLSASGTSQQSKEQDTDRLMSLLERLNHLGGSQAILTIYFLSPSCVSCRRTLEAASNFDQANQSVFVLPFIENDFLTEFSRLVPRVVLDEEGLLYRHFQVSAVPSSIDVEIPLKRG